ncbi:hypothetical protein KR093_003971 [Drosophila rubida]|uniref:Uncharacterized protein n=1 Tax=Drosophila rubida TaxID=30044 RepID=A0AAD4JZH6_9MUSC|nr:hypothetical protein KR093_003971 [Drosophila rubida]
MWQVVVLYTLLLCSPSWTITLQAMLHRCQQEQHIETMLLLQHRNQLPCNGMEQVAAAATWPTLRLNNEANFYLRSSQSTEMLALLCLTESREVNMEMWQALATNLNNMRHVRLLVLQHEAQSLRQLLEELSAIAQKLRFPHVVLLAATGHVYRLQPYGSVSWLQLQLDTDTRSPQRVFVKQHNYHLLVAHTLPDQVTSLSLVYVDKKTQLLRMTGFVARLMQEFTRVHNISLRWQRPVMAGEELSIILLRNMTLNGTLNLPITLCGFEEASALGIYSYPYDIPSWFIMVPCPRQIATADVFPALFNWRILSLLFGCYSVFVLLDSMLGSVLTKSKFEWTNLICNERVLSGIVGQSLLIRAHSTLSSKITQAQLFVVSLMIGTIVSAHLKTLLTKPPTERKISNFPELKDSDLRIFFEESEHYYVSRMSITSPIHPVRSKIEYLPTNEFYAQRKSLSVLQGFSVTLTEWNMIKRQQEHFHQPAFCYYPDLVFHLNLLMSVPLEANSIYAESLDLFIHKTHSSGLLDYWKAEAVRDLIALGQISLKDPYQFEPFHEFKVEDLLWVWLIIFMGSLVATLAFMGELFAYHMQRKVVQLEYTE